MNKRDIGNQKESIACKYLEENEIKIIYKNFRCKIGEIDLIGLDKDTYVFFEVKYRSTADYGYAAEAINIKKIKKICKVSDYFRLINKLNEYTPMRFDVIAIDGDKINWIKNAFDYIG